MTLGLKPVPQILPALLIERRRVPVVIPEASVQAVDPIFHPVRNWNGSYVAALADKIGNDPMLLPLLDVFNA